MRDTGPVSKQLTGDTEATAPYMGVARVQLGILKNQMALGNLQVGARTVQMPDGTTIRVALIGGVSRVAIDSPGVVVETQPEQPQAQVHPEFPEPPPQITPFEVAGLCLDSFTVPPALITTYTINGVPQGAGLSTELFADWVPLGAPPRVQFNSVIVGQGTLGPTRALVELTVAKYTGQHQSVLREGTFASVSWKQTGGTIQLVDFGNHKYGDTLLVSPVSVSHGTFAGEWTLVDINGNQLIVDVSGSRAYT